MRRAGFIGSVSFFAGLVLVFAGERLFGAGAARLSLTASGGLLVAGALLHRALGMRSSEGARRVVERDLLLLQALGAAALATYFLGTKALGETASTLVQALWPVLMAASVLPLFLAELAYASMARAPRVEVGRVRDAVLSGLGLAAAVTFAFAAYYVAAERDVKWDLAYFRTARPGASTRAIVRGLSEPVQVALFFPPANEVRELVAGYFGDLERESGELLLAHYDQAIDVAKARELGVSANGSVVVAREGRKEKLILALEVENARNQLRNLDREINKRLLLVSRERKAIYFTIGHGERSETAAAGDDARWTIRDFRARLAAQNYDTRTLGAADGLANDVPEDAAAVFVAGPTRAFLPEEAAALARYSQRGGRLFIALDPEAGLPFDELLQPLGLRFVPVTLANEQVHLARTHQPSDRAILVTTSSSSHPAASTVGRLGGNAPVVLVGAGYLEKTADEADGPTVDFPLRALPTTFDDRNANFTFDPPDETKRTFELLAAVTRKMHAGAGQEGRALVFADSDLLTDPVFANAANEALAMDGAKWLLGEESIAGEVASEEDTPVQHTKRQNVAWFYGSVFAAPALVLACGWLVTRRRRRSTREGGADAQEPRS